MSPADRRPNGAGAAGRLNGGRRGAERPPKVRRHRPRVSRLQAGALAVVVIGIACYLVFGGSLPFSGSGFVLRAAFTTNTNLHIPSPVRIAGVDVGQVVSVKPIRGSSAGIVTMDIDQNGLPIHSDATLLIRSRIFLEGNFYVALSPGSPDAPVLRSGATIPAANTSGPVQLDRVLSALNSSTRSDLQALVRGFGASLNAPPDAADEAGQDPSVAGLTGAQALNDNLKYAPDAFKASSIVNEALLGQGPHDLAGVVKGESEVFRGLAQSGSHLQGFVTNFERTLTALADRQQALAATVAVLPPLLRSTDRADASLDRSFAPTQSFAREIMPGIRQLAPTINVALPWLGQLTALSSRSELGGLLSNLTPATQRTAATIGPTERLTDGAGELARCFSRDIVPTGNETISDPPDGTGLQVYQELFQSAVGIAGASQNFDGNGRYVRASAGGGSDRVQTKSLPINGALYGNAILAPLGTRPAFPLHAPPLVSTRACSRNQAPDLNAAATGVGP